MVTYLNILKVMLIWSEKNSSFTNKDISVKNDRDENISDIS